MGLITAVRENRMRIIPFGLLLLIGWLLVSLVSVWQTKDPFTGFGGQYVGHHAVSGYIGVLVMLAVLFVGVYLFAEAGETGPGPERFPPR